MSVMRMPSNGGIASPDNPEQTCLGGRLLNAPASPREQRVASRRTPGQCDARIERFTMRRRETSVRKTEAELAESRDASAGSATTALRGHGVGPLWRPPSERVGARVAGAG